MQLLRASFDSLTSLTLAVRVLYGIVTDGLLESHLASARFPSLRHLDLTVSEVVRAAQAENLLRFVVLHAPQLEALVRISALSEGI